MCRRGTDALVKLNRPRPVSGRAETLVDACIAPLVQALNDAGVETLGCCCGHGREPGSVLFYQDGEARELRLDLAKEA